MRYRLLFAFLLIAGLSRAQTTVSLQWQGRARTYLVYTPTGYTATGPKLPLVVSLHPGLSNASSHAAAARWHDKGNAEQFITVYPNGTPILAGNPSSLQWNAYEPSTGSNVDDVGFLNALLNQLSRQYAVDTTRHYLAGFSNGAWMTFRMGCDFTRRFAALGPVSGSWKYGGDGRCDHGGCNGSPIPGTSPPAAEASVNCVPDRSIPIMFFRGTRESSLTDRAVTDPLVPYFWSRLNGCQTSGVRDSLTRNGDLIRRDRHPGCGGNAEVVVMSVAGNSHFWHASATDELWAFFSRFRRLPSGTVLATAPAQALTPPGLYPNPAAQACTVQLILPQPAPVLLECRDTRGRLVAPPYSALLPAGQHRISLPLTGAAPGIYLVRVRQGHHTYTLPLRLLP